MQYLPTWTRTNMPLSLLEWCVNQLTTNTQKARKQNDEDLPRYFAVHDSIAPPKLQLLAQSIDNIRHAISSANASYTRYFKPYTCKICKANVFELARHHIVNCHGTYWWKGQLINKLCLTVRQSFCKLSQQIQSRTIISHTFPRRDSNCVSF